MVPLAEEAMDHQFGFDARCVHEAPASADVQTCPPLTTAASMVPSAEEAMDHQFRYDARCVHEAPASVEVYM